MSLLQKILNFRDKQNVVNTIQQYYDKVWEKGDLSWRFLVAKGDKILFESYRGFAKENNQVPINKDVPLHIASISQIAYRDGCS